MTLTKERIAQFIANPMENGLTRSEQMELARIALAALESRADANSRKLFTCSACGAEGLDEPLETQCHCLGDGAHWVESTLYTRPQPAPVVVPDRKFRVVSLDALGAACGALQKFAPDSKTLALLRRYTFGDLSKLTQPAPVPVDLLSAMEEVLRISDRDHDAWHKAKTGIVSCRAAMLQGGK